MGSWPRVCHADTSHSILVEETCSRLTLHASLAQPGKDSVSSTPICKRRERSLGQLSLPRRGKMAHGSIPAGRGWLEQEPRVGVLPREVTPVVGKRLAPNPVPSLALRA